MAFKFETRVTAVEEHFSPVAIKNLQHDPQNSTSKFYTFEQRSKGWFVVLPEFGMRIYVGDKKPNNVKRGSVVTLIIHDFDEPTEQTAPTES